MGHRNPTTIGRNLRKIRKGASLSQFELAALADVGRSTIALLESGGRRSVATSIVERLATALKVPAAELFREAPPETTKQAS